MRRDLPSIQERLLVLGALVLAGLYFLTGMDRGWSSDEVALVQPWSIAGIYWDPESGANPPLHRIIINLLAPDSVLTWGRWFSWACAVAALLPVFALGKRLGGVTAGLLALALIAVNPIVVEQATLARSYALWLLVASWHAYALASVAVDDAPRRLRVVLAVTSLLLPWIHYLSIPLLVVEVAVVVVLVRERARRVVALVVVPLAIAVIAVAPLLLGDSSRRMPGNWAHLGSVVLESASAGWPLVGVALLPWLVAMVVFRRHVEHGRLALVAGFVGALASTIAVAPVALVRTPTALFAAPFVAPLLAAPPSLKPWLRRATQVIFVIAAVLSVLFAVFKPSADARDGVKSFVDERPAWEARRAGRAVYVTPAYHVPAVYYSLTGRGIAEQKQPEACLTNGVCFHLDGVAYLPLDPSDPTPDGIVAWFVRSPPPLPCERIMSRPYVHVFDCRK